MLKTCPFCGGKPSRERIEPHTHPISFMPDYPGAWIINCDACEFRMFSHESIADVERKWNQRVITTEAK
ncbi:restriction alleviation protein, Lar family [Serratia marcescens]|nr:restriction alleviation protein, Lar family [Serratia marcescens]